MHVVIIKFEFKGRTLLFFLKDTVRRVLLNQMQESKVLYSTNKILILYNNCLGETKPYSSN